MAKIVNPIATNPRSASTAMEQLRMRYGIPRSFSFFDNYPSAVGSINTIPYGERMRHENILKAQARMEANINRTTAPIRSLVDASPFRKGTFSTRRTGVQAAMSRFYQQQAGAANIIGQADFTGSMAQFWGLMASSGVIGMQGKRAKVPQTTTTKANKDAQKNVAGGIWAAFGGKSVVGQFMRTSIGMSGVSLASRAAKFLLYENALQQSQVAMQVRQEAELSGATPEQVGNMGYALQKYGGNASQAAQLYGKLNQLFTGGRFGVIPSAFKTVMMRYGIPFLGRGGIASPEEYIDRLADKLKESSPQTRAAIAQLLGLTGAQLDLLKNGAQAFHNLMIDAERNSPFADKFLQDDLNKTAESVNLFKSSLDKALMNLARADYIDDILNYWKDHLDAISEWIGKKYSPTGRALSKAQEKIGTILQEEGYSWYSSRPGTRNPFAATWYSPNVTEEEKQKMFRIFEKMRDQGVFSLAMQHPEIIRNSKWYNIFDNPLADFDEKGLKDFWEYWMNIWLKREQKINLLRKELDMPTTGLPADYIPSSEIPKGTTSSVHIDLNLEGIEQALSHRTVAALNTAGAYIAEDLGFTNELIGV